MTYDENMMGMLKYAIVDRDESVKRLGYEIPGYMLQEKVYNGVFMFGKKTYPNGQIFSVGKPQTQDGHILVLGGAGTGKTSCIAIPTLLTWRGPIFAIDIKGDLSCGWNGYRQNDTRPIKHFEFSVDGDCRYDPFYFLRESDPDDLVQNARELAQAIIPVPPNVSEPFWSQAAQNILTAVFLYVCGLKEVDEDTGELLEGTFCQAVELIQSIPIWKLITEIKRNGPPEAVMHINQFSEIENPSDNKMLAGISAELSNRVMVFATDNRIKNAFTPEPGASMLRWEDLEDTCVFMRLPEDKLGQWDAPITLMLTQMIRSLERRPDKYTINGQQRNLPPVLLLLDEFPRLGKMDVIQNAVSTLRSKGVTICLMMQSLAQLDKTYGREARQVIVDNCQYKAILGVTDPESQRIISDMIGTIAVKTASIGHAESLSKGKNDGSNYGDTWSSSSGASKGISNSANFTMSIMREPIVFPHELATLKDIVLITPDGFCRVDKQPYYSNLNKTKK